MNLDGQGNIPTRITKWDVFALFSNTASDIADVASNFFQILTEMLATQASFVEDEK